MAELQRRVKIAVREGTMVTIILEPKGTEYKVHKELLASASKYFRNALTGPWVEAEERSIKIEDVDDDAFDAFMAWMYAEVLPDKVALDLSNEWQILMAKLYVLGDRFQVPKLKQASRKLQASDLLSRSNTDPPYFEAIKFAFENLPSNDVLLQLYTDVFAKNYKYTDAKEAKLNAERLPHDFLVSVMMRYSMTLGSDRPRLSVKDYTGTEA